MEVKLIMDENVIEWITGDNRVTLSLTQRKYINKIKKLAANNSEVEIVAENADGSICAHLPLSYIKISKPASRNLTDEQREVLRNRFKNLKQQ